MPVMPFESAIIELPSRGAYHNGQRLTLFLHGCHDLLLLCWMPTQMAYPLNTPVHPRLPSHALVVPPLGHDTDSSILVKLVE